MAVQDEVVSQFSTLIANYPNARAKAWSVTAVVSAERNNIFAKLEGAEGSRKPVWRKDDFKRGKGDTITFTSVARLGGQARTGSQTLVGAEELAKLGNFILQIDIKRHATGLTLKHKMLTAIQLEGLFAAMLGDHAGWTMESDMMMSVRQMANNLNTAWGGNKGSINNLKSSDVLNPSLIEMAGELGKTNMAKPIAMSEGTGGYWQIPRYMVVAPHPALSEFRQSSQFQAAAQQGAERGKNNPLFTGDFYDWAGHAIVEHVVEDDDSNGPIGSAFAAKAFLGVAIASPAANAGPAITIQGGYNAEGAAVANPGGNGVGPVYFCFFANYDWQWVEGQTANPMSGDQFAIIYNLTDSAGGAAGDTGKFGFYRYQINNGYTLTTAAYSATAGQGGGRLSANANGGGADTQNTTVGYVTWNSGLNTSAHPTGSVILQSNAYGVTYGYSALLGAGACMRGYGEGGIQKISQDQDYKFKQASGYMATYGQTPYYDTNNNPKRFVLLKHAIQYAGVCLPVVQ